MIIFEQTEVVGFKHAIRGMRNPMNSWEKSDSIFGGPYNIAYVDKPLQTYTIMGVNDHKLMMSLSEAGPVHAKYRRMITVYVDITAPLYWWKEFDTYKVGTVANSCSTMNKIHAKEFTIDDFSYDNLNDESICLLEDIVNLLNKNRAYYISNDEREIKKEYWWQMIQLLPSSYNQKRTIMMNYEVLAGIYPMRKNHKLGEWRDFCDWIKLLPYSEIIIGGE